MKAKLGLVVASVVAAVPVAVGAQTYYSAVEPMQAGFGRSVAAGPGVVFVGEPANRIRPGIVYVFQPDGNGAWTERGQLTASDAESGDAFGTALALSGSTLLVGGEGAAYVFGRSGSTWSEVARLAEDMGGPTFGSAVATNGEWTLVGAPEAGGAGEVFAFRRSGARWTLAGRLQAAELPDSAGFGTSLTIGGDMAVVGAADYANGTGTAYVFRLDAGAWNEEAQLSGLGTIAGNRFGTSVAIRGDEVHVGAPGYLSATGAVFAFGPDGDGNWTERGRLLPFDGNRRTMFGTSIALSAEETFVGAPGAAGSGVVYRFTRDEGGWGSVSKLADPDGATRDLFGAALAVGEGIVVAGVARDDYGAGTAMIFVHDAGTAQWLALGKVVSEVESIEAVRGGQVDCTSGAAHGFDCGEVDLVSFVPVKDLGGARGVRVNDVWGWTDPQTGREYVLVGRTDGTSFVDITDPQAPVVVGNLPKTEAARGSTWRDMKVYRDHAFIVSDGAGQHGMQVFDLTQLRDVRNAPITLTETAHYDGIASAHNIVINEETGFAYSVGSSSGGESCGGGLHMIDIREPRNPRFAGCFADPNTGRRLTGYSHDAQCVVYHGPDRDHEGKEICFGSNETALSVADVSDKDRPVSLAMASYPNVGYAHQGWLSEDQRYFYMNDELDELRYELGGTRTMIWDVSDLDDPILVKEHISENQASDHNLYVRGNLMYQANYQSGLRVLDIQNPESPVEVAFFDTVPYGEDAPGMGGAWSSYPFFQSGVIAVTSGNEGLFIVRKRPTEIIP